VIFILRLTFSEYSYTGKLHCIDKSIKYPFIMLLSREDVNKVRRKLD